MMGKPSKLNQFLDSKTYEVEMSVRVMNVLNMSDCETMRDVMNYGLVRFAQIAGCGKKTLEDIKALFKPFGIVLTDYDYYAVA